MIIALLFFGIFDFVLTKFNLELKQKHYLNLAQEKQEIELKVMACVVDPHCYDLSFYMNDSQVEIYFLDTEVTVDVFGKHTFTILMDLDLDKFFIKSYNYDENSELLEEYYDFSQ